MIFPLLGIILPSEENNIRTNIGPSTIAVDERNGFAQILPVKIQVCLNIRSLS